MVKFWDVEVENGFGVTFVGLDEMAMIYNGSQHHWQRALVKVYVSQIFFNFTFLKKVGASLERASTLGALPRHSDYPLPQLLLLIGHIICLVCFVWYL